MIDIDSNDGKSLKEMQSVARRTKWQLAKVASKLCRTCGKNERHRGVHGRLSDDCFECLETTRQRKRAEGGFKPWKPGGPGRPPAYFKKVQAQLD